MSITFVEVYAKILSSLLCDSRRFIGAPMCERRSVDKVWGRSLTWAAEPACTADLRLHHDVARVVTRVLQIPSMIAFSVLLGRIAVAARLGFGA